MSVGENVAYMILTFVLGYSLTTLFLKLRQKIIYRFPKKNKAKKIKLRRPTVYNWSKEEK